MRLGGWHCAGPGHWWARGLDTTGRIWRFELDRQTHGWLVAQVSRGAAGRCGSAPSLDEAKQLVRRWAQTQEEVTV